MLDEAVEIILSGGEVRSVVSSLVEKKDFDWEEKKHTRDASGRFVSKATAMVKSVGKREWSTDAGGHEPRGKATIHTNSKGLGDTSKGKSGDLLASGARRYSKLLNDPAVKAVFESGRKARNEADEAGANLVKLWKSGASRGEVQKAAADYQQKQHKFVQEYKSKYLPAMSKAMGTLQNDLKASSGVSKAEATALVETKDIKAKRIIFGRSAKVASVKKDMADFAQLTGYKLKGINKVTVDGSVSRSYAINDEVVLAPAQAIPPVVFHEIAHHLEQQNPKVLEATEDWVRKRAFSSTPERLSRLTGHPYPPYEKAHPDDFVTPYAGKMYPDIKGKIRATEVVSVGLQFFESKESMATLALLDPEHFKLMLGVVETIHKQNKA